MDDLFKKIVSTTFTVRDLKKRLVLLRGLLQGLFFDAKNSYLASVNVKDRQWMETLIETTLENANTQTVELFNGLTKTNFSDYVSTLEEKAKEIKPLTVFLALPLPEGQVYQLAMELREKNGSDFFLDIKYDASLIGGCTLVYNGIYKDYSLKKKLEENKEKIRHVILNSFQDLPREIPK